MTSTEDAGHRLARITDAMGKLFEAIDRVEASAKNKPIHCGDPLFCLVASRRQRHEELSLALAQLRDAWHAFKANLEIR